LIANGTCRAGGSRGNQGDVEYLAILLPLIVLVVVVVVAITFGRGFSAKKDADRGLHFTVTPPTPRVPPVTGEKPKPQQGKDTNISGSA
jgi:hypothetical protein